MNPVGADAAILAAEKLLVELVHDFQAMENMPFTMEEVAEYAQGMRTGGHDPADFEKLGQQLAAWECLINRVRTGAFSLCKEEALLLQGIVAKYDALAPGRFRTGQVGIAGTEYLPPEASELRDRFNALCKATLTGERLGGSYELFLQCARNQFFWDGNKRTGLLLANGALMQAGYPPLSVPAARLPEFNALMVEFYESGDSAGMIEFLKGCHDRLASRCP